MERKFSQEAAHGHNLEKAERESVPRAALQQTAIEDEVGKAVVAMLTMPCMCGADINLSAGINAQ